VEATKTLKLKVLNLTRRKKEVLDELFSTYREMVEKCLDYAVKNNITSRTRLHKALYKELREREVQEISLTLHLYSYNNLTFNFQIFQKT